MAKILLVTINYINPADSSTGTLYYTNAQAGYITRASDTPASATFEPWIETVQFRIDPTTDQKRVGSGVITITNTAGDLDNILDYVYDGQSAMLYYGDPSAAFSTFVEYARWIVEQPESQGDSISFVTRNAGQPLDVALQTVLYGGSGTGVDGGSDLAGKPKPLCWGIVFNAPAVLIDSSKLMYELSSAHGLDLAGGLDATSIQLYDAGVALTTSGPGSYYASVVDMTTNPPAVAAQVLNATGSGAANNYGVYCRLQSTPAGLVTFDGVFYPCGAVVDTSTFLSTAIRAGTGGDADVYAADKTAITAALPYTVGLYAGSDGGDPPTFLDAINTVLAGSRGWAVQYQGVPTQSPASGLLPPYAIRFLDTPTTAAVSPYQNTLIAGTATLVVDGSTIVKSAFSRIAQVNFGWPEWRVSLLTDHTVAVQTAGLAGATSVDRRQRLALSFLTTSDADASIKTNYPTAIDRSITTGWSSDVGTIMNEATRQLGVFGVQHPTFTLKAYGDLAQVALAVPGDPITIQNFPRYGCDVSRTFLLLALTVDYTDRRDGDLLGFTATLWG